MTIVFSTGHKYQLPDDFSIGPLESRFFPMEEWDSEVTSKEWIIHSKLVDEKELIVFLELKTTNDAFRPQVL